MVFVSCAQFYADVFLWRCFTDQDCGYYVDVGAAWPDVDSVIKVFYDKGWSRINIEPNEDLDSKLCTQRPRDLNLNVAVSDREKDIEISFFQNVGLSTADQEIAQKPISNGEIFESRIVKAYSLATILNDHLPPNQVIDFLKIDVEGLDRSVLEGIDFCKTRPKIILVESTAPMSQDETWEGWETILTGNSNVFACFHGLNRFYIANEHLYLKLHFLLPVNLRDDVETQKTSHLPQENDWLKKQLQDNEMDIVKLGKEITSVYDSKSWRITKIFRQVMYGLEKFAIRRVRSK
tara:strand:+ start:856 stop:1731 length:876 start_codon:yes stop_codon:yes gene_type:complete